MVKQNVQESKLKDVAKMSFLQLTFIVKFTGLPKLTDVILILCIFCKPIFLKGTSNSMVLALFKKKNCGTLQRKQQTSFNVRDSPVCGLDRPSPKRLSFKTPLSANGSLISQNGSLEGKAEKESF